MKNVIVNKPSEIFDKIKNSDFYELLSIAKKYRDDFDVDAIYKDYISNPEKNKACRYLQTRWINSLENKSPDYSVYDDVGYLEDDFSSWKYYSRRYVKLLDKLNLPNIKSVVDLGAGIGYSSIALKSIFPDADISFTNIPNTLQWYIMASVTNNFNSSLMPVPECGTMLLKHQDLIFASEFFEHIYEPIKLLDALIENLTPTYFVFANTFTQMATGHFYEYLYNGNKYDGRTMSRLFNKHLRNVGYKKLDTGFFNNRPQVYVYDKVPIRKLF